RVDGIRNVKQIEIHQVRYRDGNTQESTHHSNTISGITLHADWMNGWDPDIMETIVQECFRLAQ
ncbi:MAG: hypothetical protein DA446_05715, partial [Bacteroidetes bacterium]